MFVVFYRAFVYPEQEKEYNELRQQIAQYFVEYWGKNSESDNFSGGIIEAIQKLKKIMQEWSHERKAI